VDGFGRRDPTPASFTWMIDLTAPTIHVESNRPILWPPNGKLALVRILGEVQDALSGVDRDTLEFQVIDNDGTVVLAGPISAASNGGFAFPLQLEAKRSGRDRDGRTYTIVVNAKDAVGNPASASTHVVVPHDMR
jgi:hypothetical protein